MSGRCHSCLACGPATRQFSIECAFVGEIVVAQKRSFSTEQTSLLRTAACVSENSPFPRGFLWVLVAARLRARVQLATLFGVYSCSLRALQRYRSSSPQWGHLSAVS